LTTYADGQTNTTTTASKTTTKTRGHKTITTTTTTAKTITADTGASSIGSLRECFLAQTNENCKLVVDRINPVAPPTVQMYAEQQLTVIVKHPYAFERYFLDYSSGQAAVSPDVAGTIIQSLLPSLAKVSIGDLTNIAKLTPNVVAGDPCLEAKKVSDTPPAPTALDGSLPVFQPAYGAWLERPSASIKR
jgi:hypothetical protein